MAETKDFIGTGRRKTAVARVRMAAGSGKIVINGRPFENYFPTDTLRTVASSPLTLTESASKFDIRIKVEGGGPNAWHRAGLIGGGCGLAAHLEVGRLFDSRSAYAGTREIRPARRSQTLPVQQALKDAWPLASLGVYCSGRAEKLRAMATALSMALDLLTVS